MAKMTDKHKMTAYILNKELGYSMSSIGKLMDVSQSTISSSIKDMCHRLEVQDLKNELNFVKNELKELGYEKNNIYKTEPVVRPANECRYLFEKKVNLDGTSK